ncbi:MAG: B12-binding domain-containing radical SAM protein [Candidatus Omnitrophica bacterium]|nr:B12-binding domain-containing radical SAM protein [Candidatus Omnitrophota bacterium]
MSVLFIRPAYGEVVSRRGKRHNRRWPPLVLLNCAAILEKDGLASRVLDQEATDLSAEEIAEAARKADFLFVTSSDIDRWQCPNLDYEKFVEFVRRLPDPDRVYLMGAHGTFYPEEFLKKTGAKGVLRGEPEWTVREIARGASPASVAGLTYREGEKIISNPDRRPVPMAEFPVPAFHAVDLNDYYYELMGDRFAVLEASRGCSFSCTFCSLTMYGNGVRAKPVENLLEELREARRHGAKNVYFIDLEFTINKKLVKLLCDSLIREPIGLHWTCQTRADLVDAELLAQMKKAGCVLIHYGVESGSQRILDEVDKRLKLRQIEAAFEATHRAGIESLAFILVGLPGETDVERQATLEFVKRLNPTYASFHVASPYPGTPLRRDVLPGELFPESVFPSGKTKEELERFARRAFLDYYARPGYVWGRLRKGNVRLWARQARLFLSFLK